jgi:ribonuclease J
MIEICTVGGYDEVGRNMTAIRVDDEVVILDMGVFLDNYIPFNNQIEEGRSLNPDELIRANAVPDINLISDWAKMVKAIIPSHAHLDHIGAIPYLADRFKAPIICTEYTAEVIKAIASDQKLRLSNRIKILNPNSSINLGKNIKVEFIQATHSIPQTVMIALHTKYGTLVYTNDFKFDNSPILGKKPNYERLRELGKKGTLAVFMDSLYSREAKKTPSEAVAREMIKEVMLGTESEGKLVIVTTFSSHIARLKSIVEFGTQMKRRIVFLGRSLSKYITAAENINLVDFSKKGEIVRYSSMVKKKLKEVEKKGRHKYLLVVTGHQGEPGSILQKIATGKLGFNIGYEDLVIFSCTVIPTEINRKNREDVEKALRAKGVRIFSDLHVSGHGAREDERDLINMLKPKHIVLCHGSRQLVSGASELAHEMGYKHENIIFSHNGNRFKLV